MRVLTVFFYLSDVEEGGETAFPNAISEDGGEGLLVKPAKGKMVVWA